MGNTLTNLIPDFYVALDTVMREAVGFLPSVMLDARVARAAVGETVRSPVAPAATAEDITPAQLPPDTGDQTFDNESVTIDKSRCVAFRWTGEETRGINNGVGVLTLQQDQIAQAIRTLINEMEVYVGGKIHKRASRAIGTAGTAPFGGGGTPSIADLVKVRKVLVDNGAPAQGWNMVMDTNASSNLLNVSNLIKVNEAGTDVFQKQGILGGLMGANLRESAGVAAVTVGTGAGYFINNAPGYAVGSTSLTLDTGTGTILAGDVITIGTDPNQYVVKTALTGGVVVLNNPGLRVACANDDAVTVIGAHAANVAFHRSAFVLATRAPALPEGGDSAKDRMLVTDPRTGFTFELSMYAEYKRMRYEVGAAWGGAAIKSEMIAKVLG